MARIVVDLDDVVYPFIGSLRQWFADHGIRKAHEMPDPTRWDFAESWGMTSEELWEKANWAVQDGFYRRVQPDPGAVEGLQELRRYGHTIHLATARFAGSIPGVMHRDTVDRLAVDQVPYDSLSFTSDKTTIRADYAIDDRVANYIALESAGVTAVLMDRPWNQDRDGYRNARVTDMREFSRYVLDHEAYLVA